MELTPSLRRHRCLAIFVVFLVIAASLLGMVGCDGDGHTPSEDLEIRTWYDLDAVRDNLAGNHILMNDLDSTTAGYTELASPTANGGKGWEPIKVYGSSLEDSVFSGTFDGQGHEIRDLFINRPGEGYVGLFSFVGEGGVVRNIGVLDVNVTGDTIVGGLVGQNVFGTVSNSYSSGSVAGASDGYGVGGLVGQSSGTVSNSHSNCSVSGYHRVGGLLGKNDGDVSNSYSTSDVTGNIDVGGLLGGNTGTVRDSYFTGSISGDMNVGGVVGSYYHSTVSNSYYDYDEVLINGENVITRRALFHQDFEQWLADGKFLDVNERLSQEEGYYLINDANSFKQLLAFGEYATLKFRLANDLNLASVPNFYIPYLAGEFDGNGHKISNLSFNFGFVSRVGLFGYLALGGNVADLAVENVNIAGRMYVGGLVGYSRGTVSNSCSTGSVTGSSYVGGLVGYVWEGSVSDSYSTGTVTGSMSYTGGLVGGIWGGTVSDSYSTGSVNGNEAGGLVGYNEHGTVNNCHSSSNVMGGVVIGGLVAENGGTVSNSYCSGNVTGESVIGGFMADNGGTVSNSYCSGNVTGDRHVGGLVARNFDTITNSYFTGSVSGNEDVGGLVAENDHGSVSDSFWDTETSGQATSAGGTGKTTAEMQDIATFSGVGWDIIEVADSGTRNPSYAWNIVDAVTYPFLSWQP